MTGITTDLGGAAVTLGSVVPPFSLEGIQSAILAHFKYGDIDGLARMAIVYAGEDSGATYRSSEPTGVAMP